MKPLLLLGVGKVAYAINTRVKGTRPVRGTTRDPNRIFEFDLAGIEPIIMPWPSGEIIQPLAVGAQVVVSFAPDGKTDAILAPACAGASKIVYISSTSVYDLQVGTIDDATPAAPSSDHGRLRLEAEQIWRDAGAIVLRCPAIYSPDSGLHLRVRSGAHKIPGDGTNYISRIHVQDLVTIILAALGSEVANETFVVGDLFPASHMEVVEWLCQQLELPLPEHIPIEEAPDTMRGNRQVNPQRALTTFAVQLEFPTYREGFLDCMSKLDKEARN